MRFLMFSLVFLIARTNCVFRVLDYVRQNFAVVFCPCNRLFVANYVFC